MQSAISACHTEVFYYECCWIYRFLLFTLDRNRFGLSFVLPLLFFSIPRGTFNRPGRKPITSDGFVRPVAALCRRINNPAKLTTYTYTSPFLLLPTRVPPLETLRPNYLFDTIRYARFCRILSPI